MADTAKAGLLGRFEGCLIGGAAGDALGYPIEFDSYESICATHGPQGIQSYDVDRSSGLALFSDDTQMTLFTASGLLNAGTDASRSRFLKALHGAYLDWLHTQEEEFRGNPGTSALLGERQLFSRRAPGNTCLSALRSRKVGLMEKPLNRSKGCGGVMRVAPVGLFISDPDEAAFVAAMAGAITHGHPMGYIPAAALAFLVNRGAFGDYATLEEAVEECANQLLNWFDEDRYYASSMADQLHQAAELAANDAPDAENVPLLGEGWVGDEALAIAVYACLRHPEDFSATLVAAVNHSGDADSTGAIAGNIAGAWLGSGAIDTTWTEQLELRDLIAHVARDLYRAVEPGA